MGVRTIRGNLMCDEISSHIRIAPDCKASIKVRHYLPGEQNEKWMAYIQSLNGDREREANEAYETYASGENNFVALMDQGHAALDTLDVAIAEHRLEQNDVDDDDGSSIASTAQQRRTDGPHNQMKLPKMKQPTFDALAEDLQAALIMLPKASDTTASLRATSEAIERICRQLKSLGQSEDHPILTTTIKSKLPTSVLTKLVENERRAGKKWNATELRQGLQDILAVKEEVQRTAQAMKSSTEDHKKEKRPEKSRKREQTESTRAFPVTQKQKPPAKASNVPKAKCFLCEDGFHWAADCKKFARREDRVKRLAEQKRCFVCLRRGHRAPDCRSRRNCANCDGRHNRAICPTPNGEHSGKQRDEKQKSTSNVGVSVDQTLSNSAVSERKQEVFLMAKEATIASPTRQTEVRAMVFFDNGSQLSYITKALANKLKLRKIRDSELEVHTFNQDLPMRMKSAVYAVHIQQNDGSMRKVVVHSTERISASFRTASWKGDENHQPSNIDALVPKDAQEPDVLIGMADFWQFLQKVERLSQSMYLIHTRRIAEIRTHKQCSFRFVPTAENPADMSTRGCSPEELQNSVLWWKGPIWLSKPEECWPNILEVEPPSDVPEDSEEEETLCFSTQIRLESMKPLIDANRFSSWNKLVRSMAFVLRFLKKKVGSKSTKYREQDYDTAERMLIFLHQRENPVTDMERANLKLQEDEYDARSPIYLRKKSKFTELIVQHIHKMGKHSGVDATLTQFLSRFWMLHARNSVRNALRNSDGILPIRPVDFLQPEAKLILRGPDEDDRKDKEWRLPVTLTQRFWDNWIKEYLPMLRKRNQSMHSSDNSIRVANVLMPNGNVLRRSICQLYSLEIPVTVFEEETDQEEQQPVPETETVKIPEEVRRYNLRKKTTKAVNANAVFYTLMTLSMFSMVTARRGQNWENPQYCPECSATCTEYGIVIDVPEHIVKTETCCNRVECEVHLREDNIEVKLPKEIVVNKYYCDVHLWTKRRRIEGKIHLHCPPNDECDLIECLFCWEQLANLNCRPKMTIAILAVGAWIVLLLCCCVLNLMRSVFLNVKFCYKWLCCCFKRKRKTRLHHDDSEEEILLRYEDEEPFRFKKRKKGIFSRGNLMAIAIICSMITNGFCCSEVVTIAAKEEKCSKSKNGTTCSIQDVTTLTLLPVGQTTCVLMKNKKEDIIGSIKIMMEAVTINCIPKSVQMTRSYHMDVAYSHRCPKMGTCEDDRCAEVRATSRVEELAEYSDSPGNSFCINSCAFLQCGCVLPGYSCLFYRTYAKPTSDTVFEIFRCPAWEYRIKLQLLIETNEGMRNESLLMVPGLTSRWKEFSFTPIAITQPPTPVLSEQFVTNGQDVAIMDHFHSQLHCVDEATAKAFNCSIDPDSCSGCQQAEKQITCQCRDQRLEDFFEDPERKLPVKASLYELRNDRKDVFAESHHAPVQVVMKVQDLKLITVEDKSECNIEPIKLTGCYNCGTGGEFTFKCKTGFGQALAAVRCQDGPVFTQECSEEEKTYSAVLPFKQADIDLNCEVECPGGGNTFKIEGTLRYVPRRMLQGYQSTNGNAKFSEESCLWGMCIDFDIWSILDALMGWRNMLIFATIVVLGIVAGLFVLKMFLSFNPMLILWRKASRWILLALIFVMTHSASPLYDSCMKSKDESWIHYWCEIEYESQMCLLAMENCYKSARFQHTSPFEQKTKMPGCLNLVEYLIQKMRCGNVRNLQRRLKKHSERQRWTNHLRSQTLKTNHLKPKMPDNRERNFTLRIAGLTWGGARTMKAYRGFGGVTVLEHYRNKHSRSLNYPDLSLVMVRGGAGHFSYFPMEVINVDTNPWLTNRGAQINVQEGEENLNAATSEDAKAATLWFLNAEANQEAHEIESIGEGEVILDLETGFLETECPKGVTEFTGESSEWPEFWRNFNSIVHAKEASNQWKMACLYGSLEGEALEFLRNLHMVPKQYPDVIEQLKQKYEANPNSELPDYESPEDEPEISDDPECHKEVENLMGEANQSDSDESVSECDRNSEHSINTMLDAAVGIDLFAYTQLNIERSADKKDQYVATAIMTVCTKTIQKSGKSCPPRKLAAEVMVERSRKKLEDTHVPNTKVYEECRKSSSRRKMIGELLKKCAEEMTQEIRDGFKCSCKAFKRSVTREALIGEGSENARKIDWSMLPPGTRTWLMSTQQKGTILVLCLLACLVAGSCSSAQLMNHSSLEVHKGRAASRMIIPFVPITFFCFPGMAEPKVKKAKIMAKIQDKLRFYEESLARAEELDDDSEESDDGEKSKSPSTTNTTSTAESNHEQSPKSSKRLKKKQKGPEKKRCGRCGETGHTSRSKKCKLYRNDEKSEHKIKPKRPSGKPLSYCRPMEDPEKEEEDAAIQGLLNETQMERNEGEEDEAQKGPLEDALAAMNETHGIVKPPMKQMMEEKIPLKDEPKSEKKEEPFRIPKKTEEKGHSSKESKKSHSSNESARGNYHSKDKKEKEERLSDTTKDLIREEVRRRTKIELEKQLSVVRDQLNRAFDSIIPK
ncbi:phlebovirus glycoprotein g2 domain-containing protein [Ditylenchus destructor]|uniref:Phlebovirus glycoprotein g2 domain-containing protein n=1 Tax=Ditylenchus destructor TaxID=166010 RepID=A0AAD4MM68_9BILA|nr:phlebovirus glycoprotein g2 domain-containing protein [Ditylenchus destructor]